MYIYPAGKKIIYHNGWWHGTNACFIRLINDSATIIVIGNKFTRAVYHAKALISIFGNYFGTTDEEEAEQPLNQNAVTDSVLRKPPIKVVLVNKKQKSKNLPHLQTKKVQRKN